ncbi:Hypothetical protein CINCED_3A002215 [Cinara cedri]|uniref:Uncharacterized protein n=1 Tax=Cinara cedri TaxID=506608 RepID=A0A5E4N2P5_9HEMI|nr:Hypothetical protein CINCED_3A002215 [Cinara cedri]
MTTPLATALCICAALLHTTEVILCGAIKPVYINSITPPLEFPSYGNTVTPLITDINPTPPLEFPTFPAYGKIIQATDAEASNFGKSPTSLTSENDDETTVRDDALSPIEKSLHDGILKPTSIPINIIAKISNNYTGNYIENKYYNSRIDENWVSIALTLFVLMVMAVIVLACSALCLKKVLNLKISKRQLLLEDCDESAMSDLIHVQHV